MRAGRWCWSLFLPSIIVVGILSTASAQPRPAVPGANRVDPKSAARAANRFVSGVNGGKWRATFVDWNPAGKAQVYVRAKHPMRRLFGTKARGTVTVGHGGDILDHNIRPGCVIRAAQATGRGFCRVWNNPVMRDLRTSKNVITLAAAAAATWAAAQFGFSYEQAISVAVPATTALLAVDLKGRRELRKAADRLADQLVDRYYPHTPRRPIAPAPGTDGTRANIGLERIPANVAPRPTMTRNQLRQDLSRKIRAELNL